MATRIAKGIAAGLIAGLAASWVMNQFQALLSLALDDRGGGNEDEDATQKLAQAVAVRTIDRRLSKDEARIAGPIVHYAYGTLIGGAYGAAAEEWPAVRSLVGTGYGSALWVIGDEIAVPLFGLSEPATEYSVDVHARALAAHVIYGITAELVRRGARALLR